MAEQNFKPDLDYYKALWEFRENAGFQHTTEVWDSRADDWEIELSRDSEFKRSLTRRVENVSAFLRGHGLLQAGSEVLDIGCGPGRFVADFARTAGYVTGMDLSPRMIEVGINHCQDCSLDNVSFLAGDFTQLDIKSLGWEDKFDLVFTSITPAIGTMEMLQKAMSICRGYCFNSTFIRWEDELEKQLAKDLYASEYRPSPKLHGRSFYALFNLLLLSGYLPETSYQLQEQSEYVELNEDLARYYAKCFSADMLATDAQTRRIHEYLQKYVNDKGEILRSYKRWYGWILWDVRNRQENITTKQED